MALHGKVALINGAGSGIGRATAMKFAAKGAKLVVVDMDSADASQTASQVCEAGGTAISLDFDPGNPAEVESLLEAAEKEFGALHYAVNNLSAEPDYRLLHEIEEAGWNEIVDRILKSVWLAMKYEIKAIKRAGGGAIVNVASVSGTNSAPGMSAFGAAKAGVISLTKSAAAEVATDAIRVNCVTPGGVLSESIDALWKTEPKLKSTLEAVNPIGRLARPGEIANCIYFICSDGASFMTGDNLVVDGGVGVMPHV